MWCIKLKQYIYFTLSELFVYNVLPLAWFRGTEDEVIACTVMPAFSQIKLSTTYHAYNYHYAWRYAGIHTCNHSSKAPSSDPSGHWIALSHNREVLRQMGAEAPSSGHEPAVLSTRSACAVTDIFKTCVGDWHECQLAEDTSHCRARNWCLTVLCIIIITVN